MWPKLAVAGALLLLQGAAADDCLYTVSVLDVAGVQCVSSDPCSGTYYASGLSQGVGACPTGTACALLPETPIMGCAATGRTDLTYVNADGTLTKDGKTVTLSGASSSTSSTSSSSSKSTASSSSKSEAGSSSTTSSSSSSSSSSSGSNASSGSGSAASGSDGGSDASNANSTASSASSAASNSSSSNSWSSESASGSYTISPGSSSANQQAEFNPGSILSDGSNASDSSSDGGLGLGSIIGIVVGCLAVVAIAAGARLLKKGKESELSTPEGAVAMEGYNNGGGGSGMTPKENVLLL